MVVALSILVWLFSLTLRGAGVQMVCDGFGNREWDCAAVGAIVLAAGMTGAVVGVRILAGAL